MCSTTWYERFECKFQNLKIETQRHEILCLKFVVWLVTSQNEVIGFGPEMFTFYPQIRRQLKIPD